MASSKREIWHPPVYEKADIRAIQHLATYAAGVETHPPSQETVRRALDWIINSAASAYDDPFRPAQQDVVNYMLGRRSVALAIIKLINLKPGIFENEQSRDGETRA